MPAPSASEVRKGDVVLVSFPYRTDEGLLQMKRRPGVIVSNDQRNARMEDVLLVPLTSNTSRHDSETTSISIPMDSEEGKLAGLRLDSVMDCTVIATIPQNLIVHKIGRFSDRTIKRIDECISRSTGLDDDAAGAGVPKEPLPKNDDTGIALKLPEPPLDEENY